MNKRVTNQKAMNKKAQFDVARKTIYWMIAGVVISIIMIAFAFVIVGYKTRLTSVSPELQAEIISLRFTNIPECFAYMDEAKVVHSGTIDLSKFTKEQMNQCYSTEAEKGYRDFNFKLELVGLPDKSVATNNYFNVNHFTLKRKVQVWDGALLPEKAELLIYVQTSLPNRIG